MVLLLFLVTSYNHTPGILNDLSCLQVEENSETSIGQNQCENAFYVPSLQNSH